MSGYHDFNIFSEEKNETFDAEKIILMVNPIPIFNIHQNDHYLID